MAIRKVSFGILELFLLSVTACVFSAAKESTGKSRGSKEENVNITSNVFVNPKNPFLIKTSVAPPTYRDNPFLNPIPRRNSSYDELHTTSHPFSNRIEQSNFSIPPYSVSINSNNPFFMDKNNSRYPLNIPNKGHEPSTSSVVSEDAKTNTSPSPRKHRYRINYKSKSEIMCEEYYKHRLLSLTSTTTDTAKDNYGNCTNSVQCTGEHCKKVVHLVVGGEPAIPGEFPHMVSLGKRSANGNFSHYCGGSLISPTWVLTAAHCTYGPNGSPNTALMGLHKLNDTTGIIQVTIKRLIRHPMYKPPPMYGDIALVELNQNIIFSKNVRPACLYQYYDSVPPDAWVSGWGVTDYDNIDLSNELQKASLELVDNIACSAKHNGTLQAPRGVPPSMICAGDLRGNWTMDTCQGDSGGPLQVAHPWISCVFQVVGVTSFSEGCALVGIPGVYTRVSHFLNWIEEHVWPN